MSKILEPAIEEQPRESLSWSKVWITAITRPQVAAYRSLLRPSMNKSSPYVWILVAALISGAITLCVTSSQLTSQAGDQASLSGSTICLGPLSAIFALPGLVLMAGAAQGLAKKLGGEGNYQQLVYLVAAGQAPLMIISSALGMIPWIGPILDYGLLIYGFFLIIVAVAAANNFGWGKAITAGLAGIVVNIALIACITLGTLIILGPGLDKAFLDAFSSIAP